MTCMLSIFGTIASVEVNDHTDHAALHIDFENKVHGSGLASNDHLTLFIEDKILAHRIGRAIAAEIGIRNDELACKEAIPIAAE